jgi:hypothetical protein
MTFTFTDSQERTYPDIIVNGAVLVAEPGQSYDLTVDPADGRWTVSTASNASTAAPQTAPEAPVAPAVPTTDPTTPSN